MKTFFFAVICFCLNWSAWAASEVLIVADEFPAMRILADQLKAEEHIPSTVVAQTNMPGDLAAFSTVIVYIHGKLNETAEKAFIDYTQKGGKLLVLHHSISSGKRANKFWFPFLGVTLPEGDLAQGGYKWIDPATLELANIAPNHFITTNKVLPQHQTIPILIFPPLKE